MFDGSSNSAAGETASVQQAVAIPAGTTATAVFYLRNSGTSAPASSTLTLSVDNVVVATFNEPAVPESLYTQFTVDLTAFAGGTRTLSFNYTRPAGTLAGDVLLLDDLTVSTSCGAPVVTVGGRVLTPTGLAVRNAVVALIDAQDIKRTATTSSFGVYSFDNVRVGETYIVTVASKRFRFAPKIIQFNASLADLDFLGLE